MFNSGVRHSPDPYKPDPSWCWQLSPSGFLALPINCYFCQLVAMPSVCLRFFFFNLTLMKTTSRWCSLSSYSIHALALAALSPLCPACAWGHLLPTESPFASSLACRTPLPSLTKAHTFNIFPAFCFYSNATLPGPFLSCSRQVNQPSRDLSLLFFLAWITLNTACAPQGVTVFYKYVLIPIHSVWWMNEWTGNHFSQIASRNNSTKLKTHSVWGINFPCTTLCFLFYVKPSACCVAQ